MTDEEVREAYEQGLPVTWRGKLHSIHNHHDMGDVDNPTRWVLRRVKPGGQHTYPRYVAAAELRPATAHDLLTADEDDG